MRFSAVAAFFALLSASFVAADRDNADITELIIETTYKPDDCPMTSQKGDKLQVHYTGKLWSDDGQFDSSVGRGAPLPVTLGAGQVIPGWDEGLVGMCLHEKRTLTIPARKAYGSRGFGAIIPANSALVFDVELMKLERKAGGGDEL